MSRCCGNTLADTIIAPCRTEVIRHRDPRRNIDDAEFTTLAWVHWFNHHRLLEAIGNIPPVKLEALYHRQQAESSMTV